MRATSYLWSNRFSPATQFFMPCPGAAAGEDRRPEQLIGPPTEAPHFRTDPALRLQPRALVQEAVSAQGVPLCHARYHSPRLLSFASQTHQARQPQHLGSALRLSLPEPVQSRVEEDRKTPAPVNSLNLQVTPPRPFNILAGSVNKNPTFTHY